MKGKTGTSMQGREWRAKKKLNRKKSVFCKNCKYMELNNSNKVMPSNSDKFKKGRKKNQIYPYICTVKGLGMFYTSEVECDKYLAKEGVDDL